MSAALSTARRPRSVAPPPACGWGMRAARRAPHPGTSAGGHFTGTPMRSLHARGAGASGDTSRMGRSAESVGHNAVPRRPLPVARPPARALRRDRRRAEGMRLGRKAAASLICVGRPTAYFSEWAIWETSGAQPLRRDAAARPARPWRRCAGRYFQVPALDGVTRYAPPDGVGPSTLSSRR